MQDFPHIYRASASGAAGASHVTLRSAGLADIESAGPVEFDGPGDRWSPETLLPAALGDCFVLTFHAVAAASRFAWHQITCDVEAVVDRVERVIRFTEFRVHARLLVPAGTDAERARRVLDKAERSCLVTNSLAAPVHASFEIEES